VRGSEVWNALGYLQDAADQGESGQEKPVN